MATAEPVNPSDDTIITQKPERFDAVRPTDAPTVTLITCGGEWNADLAEYDAQTVVCAVQVDIQPAEAASTQANGEGTEPDVGPPRHHLGWRFLARTSKPASVCPFADHEGRDVLLRTCAL